MLSMNAINLDNCSAELKTQIDRLVDGIRDRLGANLAGVYLTGSLAMGCYNPASSDVDLLAVVREPLDLSLKKALIQLMLFNSGKPAPIEISYLSMQALHPWRYPTPYELHYSETWRPQFEAFIHNGTSGFEPLTGGLDSEMAAAITLIHHRGVGLWGASANSVLPSVPEKDSAHSIQSDAHWAVSLADSMPVYTILNLCRCLAYMQDKAIFSKEEGGVWALTHLPAGWAPVVRKALDIYRGEQTEPGFAKGDLRAFTSGVLRHIDRLVEKEYPVIPQEP
jgi:hypothetical protein